VKQSTQLLKTIFAASV